MKLGVLGDIHGNSIALEVVLEELIDADVDAMACTGDIVGVLGEPNKCIDLVRSYADYCVYGNHDSRIFDSREFMPVRDYEVLEYESSIADITEENYDWLCALPDKQVIDGHITLVHATPVGDDYEGKTAGNAGVFPKEILSVTNDHLDGGILLLGHTHKQHALDVSRFDGQDGLVVNPGSVGHPIEYSTVKKGTDPEESVSYVGKAEYAIVDTESYEYTLESVTYDSSPIVKFLDKHSIS